MPAATASCAFRPLKPGATIYASAVQEVGTIGCFARRSGDPPTDVWLVSASHVLQPAQAIAGQNGVFQPRQSAGMVAVVGDSLHTTALDVWAARLMPGMSWDSTPLGLSPLHRIGSPAFGMRVLKSGRATGVTEGIITQISGDTFQVESPPPFPDDYPLTEAGDSGALWVDAANGDALGIHLRGLIAQNRGSEAVLLPAALAAMRMTLLT